MAAIAAGPPFPRHLPMIGLIALAIAFLTLLAPSPASAQDKAPQAPPHVGTAAETATWADPDDVVRALLGAWQATVTFPDGTVDETSLEVARPVDQGKTADTGRATAAFGPDSERYTGPLTAHREGADIVFAGQIQCAAAPFHIATLTGCWSDGSLRGTAFLADGEQLVTWRAVRPTQ